MVDLALNPLSTYTCVADDLVEEAGIGLVEIDGRGQLGAPGNGEMLQYRYLYVAWVDATAKVSRLSFWLDGTGAFLEHLPLVPQITYTTPNVSYPTDENGYPDPEQLEGVDWDGLPEGGTVTESLTTPGLLVSAGKDDPDTGHPAMPFCVLTDAVWTGHAEAE